MSEKKKSKPIQPDPSMTPEQLEEWIHQRDPTSLAIAEKEREKRLELARADREYRDTQKQKAMEEKKAKERMEEQTKVDKIKQQMEMDLYGRTPRHREIESRWQSIEHEIRDLSFSGSYVPNSEQKLEALKKEREDLKIEYLRTPFEWPLKTFSIPKEYVYSEDMKIVNENGKWVLKYKNTDMLYKLVYNEQGIPVALETSVGNETISKMFGSAFIRMKVRIPIVFSPKLESKEEKKQ